MKTIADRLAEVAVKADTRPVFYGYCRVSTDGQDPECASQKRIIKKRYDDEFSEKYRWGGFFVDAAVSGKVNFGNRAAGHQLLEAIDEGDIICGAKLDRISRCLRDFSDLISKLTVQKAAVYAIDMSINTTTTTGRMIAHILCAIAEWECERINERIREGFRKGKAEGIFYGHKPTRGYKIVGPRKQKRLMPWLPDQMYIKQIWIWQQSGYTAYEIYCHLRRNNIVDPQRQRLASSDRSVYDACKAWPLIMGGKDDLTKELDDQFTVGFTIGDTIKKAKAAKCPALTTGSVDTKTELLLAHEKS
jgi:DNA invertase Pin-like site-specific DNA recombinase